MSYGKLSFPIFLYSYLIFYFFKIMIFISSFNIMQLDIKSSEPVTSFMSSTTFEIVVVMCVL